MSYVAYIFPTHFARIFERDSLRQGGATSAGNIDYDRILPPFLGGGALAIADSGPS